VDLQERRQLEAARQHVALVRARTRPWRYIFALVLAIIAAAISVQARHTADLLSLPGEPKSTTWLSALGQSGNRILEYGTAVAFFLLAGAATIGLGNKARDVLQPSVGSAHAGIVRFAVVLAGGLATVILTLQLFNIAVTQLVVGGALTGVLVGIAAQQSLANVFAGIVLLLARPFQVGDHVGIRSGALSGLIEGTVSEVSITYVRLETEKGPVHLPNSQVLAAAVGPAGAVPSPLVQQTLPAAAEPPPEGPGASWPSQSPGPTIAGAAAALPPGAPGPPADPKGPTEPQPPGQQAAPHEPGSPPS
jgi:small-conductance mechanosensitive channel